MMTVQGADGCDLLADDGSDATLRIHKGSSLHMTIQTGVLIVILAEMGAERRKGLSSADRCT